MKLKPLFLGLVAVIGTGSIACADVNDDTLEVIDYERLEAEREIEIRNYERMVKDYERELKEREERVEELTERLESIEIKETYVSPTW